MSIFLYNVYKKIIDIIEEYPLKILNGQVESGEAAKAKEKTYELRISSKQKQKRKKGGASNE